MTTVAIVYGTHTGETKRVAERLRIAFGDPMPRLMSVYEVSIKNLADADLLVLAAPTWGVGDLPDGFDSFLLELEHVRWTGRTVALLGLGDQLGHPDSFVDAMGLLYDKVVQAGASVIGAWPTAGYRFLSSHAVRDGAFVGLAIDELCQPEQTGARLDAWVGMLRHQLGRT